MYEVKTDALDASFDAIKSADQDVDSGLNSLRAEVADLRTQLNQRVMAVSRPHLSGIKSDSEAHQFNAFTEHYLRKGVEVVPEQKALSGMTDAEGGYAVPREIDGTIQALLNNASPIRTIANVVTVGSAGYRRLVSTGGVASGWAAENAARPETATPAFAEIAPPMGDLYANPAATQAMLDDASFDVETWLAEEIASEFARAEGQAFVKGSGIDQPMGFLSTPTSASGDDTRGFGSLQFIASGNAGAFPTSNPQDKLIELVHALKPSYRQGASWVMNSATLASIRKMKTSDGAFIWQPGLVAGQPQTLLGYPVVEAEDMPDIAAGSMSIAFGNFKHGYLITERATTHVLRDPFTHKPFVHFYASRRVGGAVANSDAIKLLKFAAS